MHQEIKNGDVLFKVTMITKKRNHLKTEKSLKDQKADGVGYSVNELRILCFVLMVNWHGLKWLSQEITEVFCIKYGINYQNTKAKII